MCFIPVSMQNSVPKSRLGENQPVISGRPGVCELECSFGKEAIA
jgi:hypothetical protein